MNNSENKFDGPTQLKLAILCIGGGNIFMLVFMRGFFYDQIVAGMKLTNTQFGDMIGLYGFTTICFYLLGGIIADKLSARKVLVSGYILTGLAGLVYSTLPSYEVGMALHFIWGVSHALIFWPSFIKLTRTLGDENMQGRLFGILEGGRAAAITLISAVAGLLFTWFKNETAGLQAVILTYTLTNFAAAALTLWKFEDTAPTKDNKDLFRHLLQVVKMPKAWIVGMAIMGIMASNCGQHYTTPYMSNTLGISGGLVIFLGFMRNYAIKPVFSPAIGFFSDKVGSASLALTYSFVLLIIVWIGILSFGQYNQWGFIGLLVLLGIAIAALRGIFFATISECDIPIEYTGAFVGFVCTLGMAPDAFLSPLVGRILDTYPDVTGYHYSFLIILGFAVMGLAMSVLLRKMNSSVLKE